MKTPGAQRVMKIGRVCASEGEKSCTPVVRHRLDMGDCRIDIERLEAVFQQSNLAPADLAQPFRRQLVLGVKRKDRRAAVVRHRVVGGAGEACGAVTVIDAIGRRRLFERRELAEPAGENRPKPAPRRHTKKTVALAELTVLVAAAGDERLVQAKRPDVERHDVQVMVRVDEQHGAVPLTCARHARKTRNDLGGLVEHGRNEHAGSPTVHNVRQAVRQRVGGPRGDLHDRKTFFREPIQLTPDRVKLAIRRHELRPVAQRQRGEQSRHQFVCVRSERDVAVGVSEQPPETRLYARGLLGRPFPFVVHQLGRIEPGLLLRLERDVGPRLVRVAGQEKTLGHTESRVVPRQISH